MRLINVETLKLESFADHRNAPDYAMLSHTWGGPGDEVLFQEMENITEATKEKKGWKKIEYTCRQAKEDGVEYAWVDTCCIDKSSSAELSEAINSMYAWYEKSKICYAYLADVDVDQPPQLGELGVAENAAPPADAGNANSEVNLEQVEVPAGNETGANDDGPLTMSEENNQISAAECPNPEHRSFDGQFKASRWFTRGWTLQELLAPDRVEFFSGQWTPLGSLKKLAKAVSTVTTIPLTMLYHEFPITSYSAAKRMSWASKRTTTRLEDEAYCLLGLFQINIPLLYGEGRKAFKRLQEEILLETADLSLFAWSCGMMHDQPLFADSPAKFVHSSQIRIADVTKQLPVSLNSKGVQANFSIGSISWPADVPRILQAGNPVLYLIPLNCYDERNPSAVIALSTILSDNRHDPTLMCNWMCRLHLIHQGTLLRQVDVTLSKAPILSETAYKSGHCLRLLKPSDFRRYHGKVDAVFPPHRWNPSTMAAELRHDPQDPTGFRLRVEPRSTERSSKQGPDPIWTMEINFAGHPYRASYDASQLTVQCHAYIEGEETSHCFGGSWCPTCLDTACEFFANEKRLTSPPALTFNLGRGEVVRFRWRGVDSSSSECALVISVNAIPSPLQRWVQNGFNRMLGKLVLRLWQPIASIDTVHRKFFGVGDRLSSKAYKGVYRPHSL